MPILTIDNVPGMSYTVLNMVYHTTARARNAISRMGSSFKATFGGKIGGVEKLLIDLRQEAIAGMVAAAQQQGADAIIGVRFDINEMADCDALCITAYGTMVRFNR